MSKSAEESGIYRFRFLLLLVALLLLVLAMALEPELQMWKFLTSVLAAAGTIAGLAIVHRSRWVLWVAVLLAVPALVGFLSVGERVGAGPHAPFFVFAAVIVTRAVLRAPVVTKDTILGSLCAYLMMGMAFASIYEVIALATPGAFAGIGDVGHARLFPKLVYFSIATLTTLGYGDVTPVASSAQSVAILESVVGILFPAVVVARLVAVYSRGSGKVFALVAHDTAPETVRQTRRVLSFTIVLILLILVAPWLEQEPEARVLLSIAFMMVLVVGVYAVTQRLRIMLVVMLLGTLSVIGRFVVPAAEASAVEILGLVAEVLFFGVVVSRIGGWGLRQQTVTLGVLLSALCVFLLIGIGFATIYTMLERVTPGSLRIPSEFTTSSALYFSFATLTTTGFGDMTPLRSIPSAIAMTESVVGVFFPAVVLARLVALYDAGD